MLFAKLARNNPCELRADFQQYYSLDIDDIGSTIRARRAADLTAMLPVESRCFAVLNPDSRWNETTLLLSFVDFRLQQIIFSLAGGKDKNGNDLPKPKPLIATKQMKEKQESNSMTIDEIQEFLTRKRISNDGN